jgi:hypothetical protein
MLNDVDLEQQGSVLWWPGGQLPTKEHPEWGGRNRQFETLQTAIDFVMQLSEPEQKTALITFISGSYDFSDPNVRDYFAEHWKTADLDKAQGQTSPVA